MQNYIVKKNTKKSKRVGRGYGSTKGGHTTGKGTKGQRSRTGYKSASRMFEGGQMPLYRRLPILKGSHSRAFAKPARRFVKSKENKIVLKSSLLDTLFEQGEVINLESLTDKGIVKGKSHKKNIVKILFDKEITKKFVVENIDMSEKVKISIEAAGGEVK